MPKHVKIPGFVEWVKPDGRWGARLYTDAGELHADMNHVRFPLPEDRHHYGYMFSIHKTKRGHTYIYWHPLRRYTKRQLKKGRIWARRMRYLWED